MIRVEAFVEVEPNNYEEMKRYLESFNENYRSEFEKKANSFVFRRFMKKSQELLLKLKEELFLLRYTTDYDGKTARVLLFFNDNVFINLKIEKPLEYKFLEPILKMTIFNNDYIRKRISKDFENFGKVLSIEVKKE